VTAHFDNGVPEKRPFDAVNIYIFRTTPVNIRHSILFGLITLLTATVTSSQTYPSLPGGEIDRATLRIQERVEELYLSKSYDRAYFIYRNELAPRGDKYAQYMIGYMHFTGAGVVENPAVALAWYRVAAERGSPPIVLARDELEKALNPAQIAVADTLVAELKAELSDRVLILDLVQDDLKLLREQTRLGRSGSASPMTIIDRRYGYMSGAHYYETIEKRLATRLAYLKSQVDVVDVEGPETMELAQIELEIKELIAELDKR
jgi:TPR repeat protein